MENTNLNIPIFRAEIDVCELAKGNNFQDYLYRVIRHYVNRGTIIKIESDENDYTCNDKYYAIGSLNSYGELEVFDKEDKQILKYPYFKDTIAIHFPDMLDSQGNKIFASLSEDRKGGDLISFNFGIPNKQVNAPVVYKNSQIVVITQGYSPNTCELCDLKTFVGEYEVIGIQK